MKHKAAIALFAGFVLLGVVGPGVANAAPPSNDDFANATVVGSTPYTDSLTIDEATIEWGPESTPCGSLGLDAKTVWYTLTPSTSGTLRATNSSSFYPQFVAVYRQDGSGIPGLSQIACGGWQYGTNVALAQVSAGETYYVQAGSNWGYTGSLSVTIEVIEPPSNDNFAEAEAITTVPSSHSVDTAAATFEAGEPVPSCGYGTAGTTWYAFTPALTDSYTLRGSGAGLWPQIAVYSGTSLGTLTSLGCAAFSNPVTFHADAGQTYYVQVNGVYGGSGQIVFDVAIAPAPIANFSWSPADPTVFETVQFYNYASDPAGLGISTAVWAYGDGTVGDSGQHRYAQDGDYDVTLTVTTPDGRSGSLTQTVRVATHDVAITKVQVPQTGNVGQTRQISVGVTNARYAETVQVQLWKSVAGAGWEQVGQSTQLVPVRGANRTTSFVFNYTFTPDDRALGKVNFQAIASIQGPRDAAPTDNTFVSLPTKVNG